MAKKKLVKGLWSKSEVALLRHKEFSIQKPHTFIFSGLDLLRNSRLWSGINAAGSRMDWSGSFKRHIVDVPDELVVRFQHLIPRKKLAGMGRHSSHECGHFRLAGPPGLVVRLILPDRIQKQLPFDAIWIRIGPAKFPDEVFRDHVVALVYFWLWLAEGRHEHGRAFGAVGVVGVGIPAAVHVPRERQQFRAVGKGVFHSVVVKLAARLLVAPAAESLGRDRPGPFGPAGNIDVMAVPVDEKAG